MALYHKYRPLTFNEIIGQKHVTTTLKNQLRDDDFAHAYLFSGPRGIGKTTTARVLAKSLNCPKQEDSEVEPDNSTQCCKEINESRSIDVIEIDAASHTGVQNVREQIIENAQFQPTKLDYKVFIIDEVHMLSKSAFNALLKTLEEPPKHVVFVLATTEPGELPDTIISRCQRFDFKKIPHDELKDYLEVICDKEDIEIKDSILDRIIDKSDGCVRDAISLLDQLNAASGDSITEESAAIVLPKSKNEDALEFLNILVAKDIKEGLKMVNRLGQEGVHMPEFTLDCIELLRYMMITKADAKTNRAGVDFNQEVKNTLEKYASKISYNDIVNLIDLFLKRKEKIKQAPLPQLPLELLILQWCESENSNSTTSDNKQTQNKKPKSKKEQEKQTNDKNEQKQDEKQKKEQKGEQKVNSQTKENQKKKEDDVNESELKQDQQLLSKTKENWDKFISAVEEKSPSLVFILKMANVAINKENEIQIKVEYGFHKEKLTQNDNKKHIEAALKETLDQKVALEVIVGREDEGDGEIGELASALGGEVVQ